MFEKFFYIKIIAMKFVDRILKFSLFLFFRSM